MDDAILILYVVIVVVVVLALIVMQALQTWHNLQGDKQRADEAAKAREDAKQMISPETFAMVIAALRERDENETGVDDMAADVLERLRGVLWQDDDDGMPKNPDVPPPVEDAG